ncbi:Asp23/Gls24 family envelope stress response protein [Kibdelosporangium lantanae]|uniref:Asp23/Gls24 family envelope stress response protein n=1 Tax=Kibdelosporangium lantanae TaxID=1497396 RepID=A0ABW3MID0_9PSEU
MTVEDAVVVKVVNLVVGKVEGVHSVAEDGILVSLDGDVATVKVSLVVEFGQAIKALAARIRTDVVEAVEEFLGFDVAAVDVHVSDVHLPTA